MLHNSLGWIIDHRHHSLNSKGLTNGPRSNSPKLKQILPNFKLVASNLILHSLWLFRLTFAGALLTAPLMIHQVQPVQSYRWKRYFAFVCWLLRLKWTWHWKCEYVLRDFIFSWLFYSHVDSFQFQEMTLVPSTLIVSWNSYVTL